MTTPQRGGRLSGKVAIVTGAASGIGAFAVRPCARRSVQACHD